MTTVFDVFPEVEMEYLTISRGNVYGNTVTDSKTIKGIFKLRAGETRSLNMEGYTSTATVHVHPEDFADDGNLVGNGIRYDGIDYEIIGMTAGTNFANSETEHLTLTLGVANYANAD